MTFLVVLLIAVLAAGAAWYWFFIRQRHPTYHLQAFGTAPTIPAAHPQGSIPTLKMPKAMGWADGAKPVVAVPGLDVEAFATKLKHPRWVYVLPNGDVLVAEAASQPGKVTSITGFAMNRVMTRAGSIQENANRITILRDADGDGVPELRETFLEGLNQPFGMALVGDTFYVGNTDGVVAFPYVEGQTRITAPGRKLTDLKPGGHWTRNLIASRDGTKLFIGVGSLSNIADEGLDAEIERAAILELDLATNQKRVFASGLRNPVGMAFEPGDGSLWTVVNERDGLGDETPPDYLTSVKDLGRRAVLGLSGIALAAGMLGSSAALAQDVTIPIIVKDTTSFYWQIVLAGARAAGAELGVNVPELGAQAETDINGQISILENAVSGNPAAIVIAPTERSALGAPITEAAASVPIIGIDSGADSDAFTSFLTTDNVQGGRIAADGLAAAIEAATGAIEGEVALITSVPNAGSLEERRQGFMEQIASEYPGLTLVADRYADGQAATGLNLTTDLLTANPNLVGIFASNLIMAQGAGQALAENDAAERVALVGFDSDERLVSFLTDGTIDALVVQDPYRMGYDGIATALAAANGEPVEEFVDTGANLITSENMNEERSQELLNPQID